MAFSEPEEPLGGVEIALCAGRATDGERAPRRRTRTADDGTFRFEGVTGTVFWL